jgi:hypothetical protein
MLVIYRSGAGSRREAGGAWASVREYLSALDE